VQVDPLKPMLKAPGTEHLKPSCDETPSDFAFKFYLRRFTEEAGLEEEKRRMGGILDAK